MPSDNNVLIVWSIDEETRAEFASTSETGATVTGLTAGEIVVTAEAKQILEANDGMISFSPAIKDTFTITVETGE